MTQLSEYLNDIRRERSVDAMVEVARKEGHDINRATVYRYLNGNEPKNPPEETLQALASAFTTDVRKLRVLAGKPAGELGPYEPPSEAARLSKDQRAALDQLIKAIVRPAREADGHVEEVRVRVREEPTIDATVETVRPEGMPEHIWLGLSADQQQEVINARRPAKRKSRGRSA